MIDIHCHILPGIDDGPEDTAEALKMARIAVKDGVRTVVATPHCFDGVYDCQKADIVGLCRELNGALIQEGIGLTVLPGAEVRFTPELCRDVTQGEALTLGNFRDFILIELPELFIPDAVVMTLRALRDMRLTTIIAHPERNTMLMNKPEVVVQLIAAGAEMQLTAESLLGDFGKDANKMACRLLQADVRCYLGSDGHGVKKRKPVLAKAVKAAVRGIGRERAAELVSLELGNVYQDFIRTVCN